MSLMVKLELGYTGAPGLTLESHIPGLGVRRSKHVQVERGQLRGLTPQHCLRRYSSQAFMSGMSEEKNESRNILHLAMGPELIKAGLYQTYANIVKSTYASRSDHMCLMGII